MNTTSTLSEARKLLKGSERESRFNLKAFSAVVVAGIVLWVGGNVLWTGGQNVPRLVEDPAIMAASTPTQVVVGSVDPPVAAGAVRAAGPVEYPTPIILYQDRVEVVEVPGPVQYVEVPGPVVEVTRIVEVPALVDPVIMAPTATPVPSLAPGTVQICARVEGASALYIGGYGIVNGGCQTFTFGVGQMEIRVQVNK